MSEQILLTERPCDGVLQLTLNRPRALNAVNMALAEALSAALEAAAADASVRVIVLAGAGERAFSAGYDIREMSGLDSNGMLDATLRRCPVIHALARHPKPVVAALQGVTHGAGALFAMAADIRIACADTAFQVAAVRFGAAEGTWQLPQLVGVARAEIPTAEARMPASVYTDPAHFALELPAHADAGDLVGHAAHAQHGVCAR